MTRDHIVRRIDGLPVDALPEPDVPDVALACEWADDCHMPSYRSGWWWGAAAGVLAGASLVVCAFLLGWSPAP